jgi:outer membrane protein OmpA-like peptidoglycan-associated protein
MKLWFLVLAVAGLLTWSTQEGCAGPTQFGDTGLLSQPSAETLDSDTFCFGVWGTHVSGSGMRDATSLPVTFSFAIGSAMEAYGSYPFLLFNGQGENRGRGFANFGFKYRFMGDRSAPLKLAVDGQVRRSIAEDSDRDGLVALQGRFVASYRPKNFGLHLNAGYLVNDSPSGIDFDNQFVLGGGVELFPAYRWRFIAELEALSTKLKGEDDPLEATIGLKYFFIPQVSFNLGVGVGLTDGSPDWRAMLGFSGCRTTAGLMTPINRIAAEFREELPAAPHSAEGGRSNPFSPPDLQTSPQHVEIPVPFMTPEIVVTVEDKFSPQGFYGQKSLAIAPLSNVAGRSTVPSPSQPIRAEIYRKFRLSESAYLVDQEVLSAEGMKLLSQIADKLRQENKRLIVRIDGHTDNIGPDRYNDDLSLKYAVAAANHLMLRDGIAPSRLFVKGFGERVPIASNDTPEGRSQNRRLELLVLSPQK